MWEDIFTGGFVKHLGVGLALFTSVVLFFERVEKGLSEDTKLEVSVWLLDLDPTARVKHWPQTFAEVFDSIFTETHLSWKCFRRSCLASLIAVAIMTMLFTALNPEWRLPSLHTLLEIALLTILLNFLPDYLSLLETRYILRSMGSTRSTPPLVLLLIIDAILTCYIFAVLGFGGARVLLLGWTSGSFNGSLTLEEFREFLAIWSSLFRLENPVGVFLWSTFFTSLWLWLYALAGLLVRLSKPLTQGIDSLRDRLKVEERPLYSIGLVAGAITALTWWGWNWFM